MNQAPPEPDENDFGFTEKDVSTAINEIEREIGYMRAETPDPNDRLFGGPEVRLKNAENKLSALKSMAPKDMLEHLRAVHSKMLELASSGKLAAEQVGEIRISFPHLLDIYPLLRKKPWGYILGQAVMSAISMDEKHK